MPLDKRELNLSIFDNSPAAYAVVEVLLNDNNKPYDWIYRYCNNAFADIKGYRRNAITDHTSLSLFTSVDESAFRHIMALLIKTNLLILYWKINMMLQLCLQVMPGYVQS